MNIHEYQAKQLLSDYGVPVPNGYPAQSESEVATAIAQLPDDAIVVKAQIHAGGRGKGTFTDGYKGGVKVTSGRAEASEIAQKMLGNTLVTQQTGPQGRKVQTLYFTEACDIAHEYYLAMVLDRESSQAIIIASTEGGWILKLSLKPRPKRLSVCLFRRRSVYVHSTVERLALHSVYRGIS